MWVLIISLWLTTHLVGFYFIFELLLSKKAAASLILWTLWLLLLPLLGVPFYLLLGTDRIRLQRLKRYRSGEHRSDDVASGPGAAAPMDSGTKLLFQGTSTILEIPVDTMARPTLLPNAGAYYGALLDAIGAARHHIHFQTFIWRDDEVGRKFLEALIEAAGRGVQVRLLVDELGVVELKETYFRPLREAGGEFSWCLTVHARRNRFFFNLRNHRKLQIVDGQSAFVGGMNIGREYQGKDEEVGPWEDTQIRVSGPVLHRLQWLFRNDWVFATGRGFDGEAYFPEATDSSLVPAIAVSSGPDNAQRTFLKTFVLFCNSATTRLDLFTPYFAPEPAMQTAMELAAARGVRVRLMIPSHNESQYMVDMGRSFYESLLRSGVEIHELPDRVHHSKVYLADRGSILMGSPNIDARSVRLNFELALLFECEETTRALDDRFQELFRAAERIDLETFMNRPKSRRLREGFVRLFTPIL